MEGERGASCEGHTDRELDSLAASDCDVRVPFVIVSNKPRS